MIEENKENKFAKDYLTFQQGQDSLINDQDSLHEGLEK